MCAPEKGKFILRNPHPLDLLNQHHESYAILE